MRIEGYPATSVDRVPPVEIPVIGGDSAAAVAEQPAVPDVVSPSTEPAIGSTVPGRPGASLTGPALVFKTLNAFQDSAALQGAIELDLFTAVGAGAQTAGDLARWCSATERGIRSLCDYLTVLGFLTKTGSRYSLTPTSAEFLNRRAPHCLAPMTEFLCSPYTMGRFNNVAAAVRKGGTLTPEDGSLTPEHPMWVAFARGMAPLAAITAEPLAAELLADPPPWENVLDLAAGHGMFGIALARHNPRARVTAVDWPNVLAVACEHAAQAGVADQLHTLPGSAFDVDYGAGYDLVLLTNFLHHFDPATCETLLRKVHAALIPSGRAVALEFVPNEDRVSPPLAATFSLTMLMGTPHGDAYTFTELADMFRRAGFTQSELRELPPTPQRLVIARK
jgi:hypothetical protein